MRWFRGFDGRHHGRRGFSLMELVVVMSVTLLLTGLMLPALSQVKENAHRVVCSSNLRQVGLGCVLYSDDTGSLPESFYGQDGQSKAEMMALHRGKDEEHFDEWEGLGWLWAWKYLTSPEVFYCPSHHGEHHFDRYRVKFTWPDVNKIYGNYHYAGERDWESGLRRRIGSRQSFVLATDGLRTTRDLNHVDGMNVLRNDNSVDWRDDIVTQVSAMLPTNIGDASDDDSSTYKEIWDIINDAY